MWKRAITASVAAALGAGLSTGCWEAGAAVVGVGVGAVATAAIISATQPPPPRVEYIPPPREGYSWQSGYWTQNRHGRWIWVEGTWVRERPSYRWIGTHWRQTPDGRWELIEGRYVPV